jgi:hypothetical protein
VVVSALARPRSGWGRKLSVEGFAVVRYDGKLIFVPLTFGSGCGGSSDKALNVGVSARENRENIFMLHA